MDDIKDERARGAIGDLGAFQKPGLETLKRFIHGELPAPPISRLTGMRVTEAGLGKATFAMPVTRCLISTVPVDIHAEYPTCGDDHRLRLGG